jgi:hypothetical protein
MRSLTMHPKSPGVTRIKLCVVHSANLALPTEDQQRINTFSKLNSRVRDIEDQLTQLKVSAGSIA